MQFIAKKFPSERIIFFKLNILIKRDEFLAILLIQRLYLALNRASIHFLAFTKASIQGDT